MERALGADWGKLPPTLRAHYQAAPHVDGGYLDISFPGWMQAYLWVLHRLGALVDRREVRVETEVEKRMVGERQLWRRRMRFRNGQVRRFDSVWVFSGPNRLIEYVNSVMGLEMAPWVENGELRYRGVRIVLRLGRVVVGLPEWLVLGHTVIHEWSQSDGTFAMDFRLHHPWFGQVFRYSGVFSTCARPDAGAGGKD